MADRDRQDKVERAPEATCPPADATALPAASAGKQDWGDDWVHELIWIANGAGEGQFERELQRLREFKLPTR